MRSLILSALAVLGACTVPAPAPGPPPPPPDMRTFTCRSEGLDRFVGELANIDVAAAVLRASGARILRWTGPGLVGTMDYRTDRVNVELDSTLHRVVRITCG